MVQICLFWFLRGLHKKQKHGICLPATNKQPTGVMDIKMKISALIQPFKENSCDNL